MSNKLTSMLSDIDTSVNSAASNTTLNEDSSISTDTPRIFPIYICINEYSQRMEDELNMKPGDKIQVITDDEEYNDGWYFGKNLRTKEEGLYPVVFTQVISTERKSTLMRAKSLKRLNSSSSNLPIEYNSNSNNGIQNARTPSGSNSALATPKEMQTASAAPFSKFRDPVNINESSTSVKQRNDSNTLKDDSVNHPLGRNISVRSTMSDIDKAIEELSFEPTESLSIVDSNLNMSASPSVADDTIITATEDLSVGDQSTRPGTSLSHRSQSYNNVNELENKDKNLNPADVKEWTPEQVTNYFIGCGFDVGSASRFKQHEISGSILLELELAHLKELDISSFGTRFEMYKEIESLKQQMDNMSTVYKSAASAGLKEAPSISKELIPPARVGKDAQIDKKMSQSMVDLSSTKPKNSLPSRANSGSNNRPVSLMVNDQITKDIQDGTIILPIAEDLENGNLFTSPRRAPKPPSYPSPVQPPKSPMVNMRRNNTPMASSKLTYSPSSLYHSPTSIMPTTEEHDESFEAPAVNNLQIPKREKLAVSSPTNDDNEDHEDDEVISVSDRPTSSVYESSSMSSSHPPTESTVKEEIENKNLHLGESKQTNSKLKRNSSLLSYFSKTERSPSSNTVRKSNSFTMKKKNSFISSPVRQEFTEKATGSTPDTKDAKDATMSPIKKEKGRSVSAKDTHTTQIDMSKKILEDDNKKRSVSEVMKPKTLRAMTTRQPLRKQKTSAFQEGLRNISVKDSLKTADYSGWMSKKGSGTMRAWRTRFFVLEGTRLSYFANTTDTKERGLIDVTGYRVVPAREDDKFVSLFAATAGKGRYCFKLLPPQPGSRKGLTFTEPRIHYFAVDSKEEMRGWIANILKTTIDIDTSVPVISSYSTPTVSLSKAKEMLAEAREETRAREQERLLSKNNNEEDDDDEGRKMWDEQHQDSSGDKTVPLNETKSHNTDNSAEDGTFSNINTMTTAANTTIGSHGFSSPYLLASGMLSPSIGNKNGSPRGTSGPNKKSDEDYFTSHSSSNHVL